jgi:hypothetical protein
MNRSSKIPDGGVYFYREFAAAFFCCGACKPYSAILKAFLAHSRSASIINNH